MTEMHPHLDDALQKRLDVLIEMKKDRVNEEFDSINKKLAIVLKQVVKKENDQLMILPNFIQELKNVNIAKEILDVLSFPVVRAEVVQAISKTGGEKELTERIMDKLVSLSIT